MLVLGQELFQKIFACFVGSVWLYNLYDQVVPYSAGSGVKSVVVVCQCFYKVISGGSLMYFVKIWSNKFLGFTMFSVGCFDCYVISLFRKSGMSEM